MESSSEHNVILPPPSARNPIPSLPAALRIDNQERLLELLLTNPVNSSASINEAVAANSSPTSFRQLLVFGNESLRTLLLRQVLVDPQARTWGKPSKKKTNKNWDDSKTFVLPKSLQANVLGTKILLQQSNDEANVLSPSRSRTTYRGTAHDFDTDDSLDVNEVFRSPDDLFDHVDVITYLIKPWDLEQTLAVIARIQACKLGGTSSTGKTHKQHHRIVYVPQVTAMCAQVLSDHKVWDINERNKHPHAQQKSCVSVCSLQLDLFPLASDVLSLEIKDGLRLSGAVGGTPSPMIETSARALAKLQDVVGSIPRIQSLGVWGEDVLTKLLNNTVDEYWGAQKDNADPDAFQEDEAYDESKDGEEKKQAENDVPLLDKDHDLAMVLLDRRLDMVTPMITPLTYEGLLDELVGIDCAHVSIPEAVINPPEDQDDETKDEVKKNDNHKNPFGNSSNTNPFDDNSNARQQSPNTVSLGVHEGDTLYAEVRDQHVETFGTFLQDQALALRESHANFTSKETKKDLDQIEKFVKQIPIFTQSLRSLTNHIHLAEVIKAYTEDTEFRDQWNTERAMIEGEYCYDFLEECIFGDHPPYKVLRLICLQSLTSGGIKANKLDQLRQHVVQVYGYEFLPIFHDLEKMGWIKRSEGNLATFMDNSSRSLFQNLKRNLILIHAEVNTMNPDDVSYVSSGYAPLTVRLIQSAMQGWKTSDKEDVLKDLFQMMAASSVGSNTSSAGRLLDIRQSHPPKDLPTTLRLQKEGRGGSTINSSLGAFGKVYQQSQNKKPTLFVVYLGGITYAEIAALRFLSKKDTFPYHIIVVTTTILNGSKLLQQMG